MKTIYVLGAPDPEMSMIERVINERLDDAIDFGHGGGVLYAAKGGVRVTADNAYAADGFIRSDGTPVELPKDCDRLVAIDCAIAEYDAEITIDRPSGDYQWEDSALGKVCHHYGIKPTHELVVAAKVTRLVI